MKKILIKAKPFLYQDLNNIKNEEILINLLLQNLLNYLLTDIENGKYENFKQIVEIINEIKEMGYVGSKI